MVVEFLTFTVAPSARDRWLAVEEREWSRYLETVPGFVRKEMWLSHDDPNTVHAVIWWDGLEAWKAVSPDEVTRIDRRMGSWFREPAAVSYEVIRER